MNSTARSLLAGFGGFVLAGAGAFAVGRAIGGDDSPPAVAPTAAQVEPLAVPLVIGPDDDPLAAIRSRAEQEAASREVASEIGQPASGGGLGVGTAETVPAASGDEPVEPPATAEPPDAPAPDGPAGGGGSASDTASDACADGGDGCPSGVGGYVLAALRMPPPLRGMTDWRPAEDSSYVWSPTCPAIDVPPGAAYFGTSTSRPVTITIRYRAGRWTGDGYEEEGTFTYTTPDAAAGDWNAWLADDAATEADSRMWIKHCFLIEDLAPRGDYIAFVDYADKYDPTVTTTNRPYAIDFDVYLDSGFLPGEQRRPTFLLGSGIDELLVGVSARPDHEFVAVAFEGGEAGSCDTGGDERSTLTREGAISSQEVSNNAIPEDRLADPLYPYLRDHTRSLVHRLWLQEGRDYIVCLYWLEGGTEFDRRLVEIAEEVAVSTPEAYQPQILLHGFTELFGEIDQVTVGVENCGFQAVEVGPFTRERPEHLFDEPLEVCVADQYLTLFDRGIMVDTHVHDTFDEGMWYRGGGWIRTDLECRADPCLLKLPELYRIPLPLVPAERRLCGTGFGSGCDGEIPMRPAGYAELEVRYINQLDNLRTEWSIGEAGEFDDTPPPPVGEAPRLDVDVDWELIGRPDEGVRGTVTVTADREVTFSADLRNPPECGLAEAGGASSDEFATVHTFVVEPLCLGERYGLSVVAYDRTRAVVGTIYRFGREQGTDIDIDVPPLLAYFDMTVEIDAPNAAGVTYTAIVLPVVLNTPTSFIPYRSSLAWSWTEPDRADARLAGWQMFGLDGQANACSIAEPGTLTVNAARRPALLAQDDITVSLTVLVYENREPGGPIGECARGRVGISHPLQATVSVGDLLSGITLTDETGRVVLTMRARTYRDALVD